MKSKHFLSNARHKWIRGLRNGKERAREGYFVAEGEKIVEEVLAGGHEVYLLVATAAWIAGHDTAGISTAEASRAQLKSLSTLSSPPEVLAVLPIPHVSLSTEYLSSGIILLCDGIRDPGNLGTLIRTADWFGHRCLICSRDCVDMYNAKALMASMGSFLRLPVIYTDLQEVIAKARDMQTDVWAAVLDGENLFDCPKSEPALVVIGSESHGIREDIRRLANRTVTIPGGRSAGHAESLNAAMAASILSAEFFRAIQSKT